MGLLPIYKELPPTAPTTPNAALSITGTLWERSTDPLQIHYSFLISRLCVRWESVQFADTQEKQNVAKFNHTELLKALSSLSALRLTPSAQAEDTARLLVKTPVQINITLISNKMNWFNRAERLLLLLAPNLHTYSNSHSSLLKE